MTTTTNNQRIRSPSLAKYIKNVQQANERTAEQYEYRLSKFEKYLVTVSEEQQQHQQQQNQELTVLDHVINELKIANNDKINPYDLLSGFVAYLQEVEGIENPNTIRYFVIAARNFLEYNDIEISPRKFKLKVRLPKPVIRHKEAIGKEEIRQILLKCSNIKLKTYLMLLAATGMRATEALALRHKDFDFDEDNNRNNRQAFVRIRGEFTKTRGEMRQAQLRLGQRAKSDLLEVLALAEDKTEILLSFLSAYVDPDDERTMTDLQTDLSKQIGVSEALSQRMLLSVFVLGSFCKTKEDTKRFLEEVELLGVTSTQLTALKELISKLRERNIVDSVADAVATVEISNFGLPHLVKMKLISDYRLLTRKNGSRGMDSIDATDNPHYYDELQ
jgi:integrase